MTCGCIESFSSFSGREREEEEKRKRTKTENKEERTSALPASATTSHVSLFLTSKLLDVKSLWKKKAISNAHRLYCQPRSSLTAQLFRGNLGQADRGFIPSFLASTLREVEELHLRHDIHLPPEDLKRVAALDVITRMLAEHSQATFLHNFDPDIIDYHLCSDHLPVIALRSRLRLDYTRPNALLHKRRMVPSPALTSTNSDMSLIDL